MYKSLWQLPEFEKFKNANLHLRLRFCTETDKNDNIRNGMKAEQNNHFATMTWQKQNKNTD